MTEPTVETFAAEPVWLDDQVIVRLSGELDIDTAPTLRGCLERVALVGQHKIVIDLSELEFCDSTGIGVFIEWQRRAREGTFDLVLRSPRAHLRRLLEFALLDGLVEGRAAEPDADGETEAG
ncbi:MAG TPA: STAS domain-containing protein [Acidimicrobiia bacterium]|nr:STAS domain-containing protein [Acidimicrobiia bacterium]